MERRDWLWGIVLGGATLTSATGCNTIKSTVVEKNLACGWTTKHHRGMPITVKVPSSVRLAIKETQYFTPDGKKYLAKNLKWVETTGKTDPKLSGSLVCEPLRTRAVEYKVIETPEIFYVDIPRPAAGVLAYGATIDAKSQYFTEVTSDINDKTVQDITKAFGLIIDNLPKPTTPAKPTSATPTSALGLTTSTVPLIEIESEIAYKVFDVRLPDLTEQMRVFANQYITDCNIPYDTTSAAGSCPKTAATSPPPPPIPTMSLGTQTNFPTSQTRR